MDFHPVAEASIPFRVAPFFPAEPSTTIPADSLPPVKGVRFPPQWTLLLPEGGPESPGNH